VCSEDGPVCLEGMIQSNIYKGARRRRMSDPSTIRRRHVSQGDSVILKERDVEGYTS